MASSIGMHLVRVGLVAVAGMSWSSVRSSHATVQTPPMDTLVQVTHGQLLDSERAAAIDAGTVELLLLDRSGNVRSRTGRRGGGPGGFIAPLALLSADDSSVGVLDPANARLQWYTRVGDALALRRAVSVDAPAVDACALGTLVFAAVVSSVGQPRVRVYGADGIHRYSFGIRGAPVSPEAGATGLQLRIACDAATRSVVLAESIGSRFEVFDLAGNPRWQGNLPGFRLQEISVNGEETTFRRPPGGAHVTTSLIANGTGLIVFAAEHHWRPRDADTATVHAATFTVDLRTRRTSGANGTRCRLLDTREGHILGLNEADVPELFIADTSAIEASPVACAQSLRVWRMLLSADQ